MSFSPIPGWYSDPEIPFVKDTQRTERNVSPRGYRIARLLGRLATGAGNAVAQALNSEGYLTWNDSASEVKSGLAGTKKEKHERTKEDKIAEDKAGIASQLLDLQNGKADFDPRELTDSTYRPPEADN